MSEESEQRRFSFKRLIRTAVQGAGLGAVILALIFIFTVDESTGEALRHFPVHTLFLLLGMLFLAWASIGARVLLNARALGYRISYKQAWIIGLSSEFGVAASPAGMGGAAVRMSLLRKFGVPLSAGTTITGADIVMDMLFFALLFPVGVYIIATDPAWSGLLQSMRRFPLLAAALILAPVGALILTLLIRGGRLADDLHALTRGTALGQRARLGARLRVFRMKLRSYGRDTLAAAQFMYRRRKGVLLLNLALASLQWSCRYGVLPVILLALNADRNPFPLMLIQGLLFSISLLLVIPGGGGGIELLALFLLPLFVPKGLIGLVLFLWRVFTYYLYLFFGGLTLSWALHRLDRIFPEEHHADLPYLDCD
jgi:glycosyltransferase 2 family protein